MGLFSHHIWLLVLAEVGMVWDQDCSLQSDKCCCSLCTLGHVSMATWRYVWDILGQLPSKQNVLPYLSVCILLPSTSSYYTAMITVVHWPKHMILVLKLTLVVEFWALLSSPSPAILLKCWLWLSLEAQLSGNAYEDSDHTLLRSALCTDTYGPKVTLVAKLWVL